MEQVGSNRQNVSPSYIGKWVIFFTPNGEILLHLGNQRLQVTPTELKAMFDLWTQIAAAFTPEGMNGNGAIYAE
ncbi:MAG: hypothetical protein ACXWPS_14565 [Ktedonobacteraceae bacterium]